MADAVGARGAGELSLSGRAMLQGSIAFDVVLRTALASMVSVPSALWVARTGAKGELERLDFYRQLAARRDAGVTFPPPVTMPEVEVLDPPWFAPGAPRGCLRTLRFESPYRAMNPDVRDEYARYPENRVAWAQHWRHADGPRPTLAVIHGFGASPYWFNSVFFSLPWLFGKGYDVLLYLLPFHGVRQARFAAFSGWGLFAHGLAHFNEAIAHAVHDFRAFMNYLFAEGAASSIGVTGLSLGGYVSALLAAVEDRLAVVVPNAPVVKVGALSRDWFPANALLGAGLRMIGTDWDELESALAVHGPLNYEPVVARERRMIIGGLGDRLAPPEQAEWLWEHWDHPRLHWFPGNHVLHARRSVYLKEMLAFMRGVGFA